MPIPKTIYQTFKTSKLPLHTRWYISRMKKRNPEYAYEFYDDKRIESFLEKEFGTDLLNLYRRINIGAMKADFFRYTILYRKGGVYLDIDSLIVKKLNELIRPDDTAIITKENNGSNFYVQWGLIYEAGHPFLGRTIQKMMDNIRHNKFPYDVHQMTGPSVYTEAINECLSENKNIPHRLAGFDYEGYLKFKMPFSKWMYKKGEHWKQNKNPVLKPEE